MSKQATFTYIVDSDFESINYYLSESPIDINSLPLPKATGITDLSYTDINLELNKSYYARFASLRGTEIQISDEIQFNTNAVLFDPISLSAVKMIIDDSSISTLVATSNEVSNIADRVASRQFIRNQVSGPALVAGALNGKNVLRFSDSLLTCAHATLMSTWKNTSKIWSFAVYKDTLNIQDDKSIFGIMTSSYDAGYSMQSGASLSTAKNKPYFFTRKSGPESYAELAASTAKNNIWTIAYTEADFSADKLRVISDGATATVKNSAFGSTANTENANSAGFTIGSVNPQNSQKFTGDIACVIYGSGTFPSATDIEKIFGWAAHRYDLTANLPASHPYKTSPPVV